MCRCVIRRVVRVMGCGVLIAAMAGGAARGAEPADQVTSLTRALAGDDVNARVAAAEALRALGPAAAPAAPALAAQLEHPLGWVRSAAVDALQAIGAGAVPAVLDVYRTGSPAAHQRATLVLGLLGPLAREALPELRAALAAAPPERQDQLREIIVQIENPEGGIDKDEHGRARTDSEKDSKDLKDLKVTHIPFGNPDDWPQFEGPRRDLASRETGLRRDWPASGPPRLWTVKGLGRGFSSVAIAGNRIFTMGDRLGGTTESQFVIALDLATRRELWSARVGPTHLKEGPRCTPTVDGELLYAVSTEGDLFCLETATGKVRWRKSLPADFGGNQMSGWKWAESPLVDGPRLVCTPGAPGAALVALDKLTGAPIWKCALPALGPKGKDGAGYSSIVSAEICGVRQYVQSLGRGVVGVEAATGRPLWSYNAIASTVANIPHPLVADDLVFATNGYNAGSVLLKITRAGEACKAEPVYNLKARQFSNHHGGIVLAGGHVYGGVGDNAGVPTCVELATGAVKWQAKAPEGGSATVISADGMVIFRYDRFGLIVLAAASPEGFKVKGSFHPPVGEGPAWAHMALHQGRLYLRHADLLMCYDMK